MGILYTAGSEEKIVCGRLFYPARIQFHQSAANSNAAIIALFPCGRRFSAGAVQAANQAGSAANQIGRSRARSLSQKAPMYYLLSPQHTHTKRCMPKITGNRMVVGPVIDVSTL